MSSFSATNSRNAALCQTRLENELDTLLIELDRTLTLGEPIGALRPDGIRMFPFSAPRTSDVQRYKLHVADPVRVETLSGTTDEAVVANLVAFGERLPLGTSGTFVVSATGALGYVDGDIPAIYLRVKKIERIVGQAHSVQELCSLVTAAINCGTTMLVLNHRYPCSPYIVELAIERLQQLQEKAATQS